MIGRRSDDLPFASIGPRTVVADYQGGWLTTDAGAPLLREVHYRPGRFGASDADLPDPRHPVLIIDRQRALLAQRITAIALGYEHLYDHQIFCDNSVFQVATGTSPVADLTLASGL